MKSQLLPLACVIALQGCMTTRSDEIAEGRATLIPNTVSVEPFVYDYKVLWERNMRSLPATGIIEMKGKRVSLQTMATDCQKGTGSLKSLDELFTSAPIAG
jgi:hypothetical protein